MVRHRKIARTERKTPSHWNAYRPSYDAPRPQQGSPSRPPAGFEDQVPDAPTFSRGQGSRRPLQSDSTNPNEIPLGPPRRHRPSYEESDYNTGAGPHFPDGNFDYLSDTDRRPSHNNSQPSANISWRFPSNNSDPLANTDRRSSHDDAVDPYHNRISYTNNTDHKTDSNHRVPSNTSDPDTDFSGPDPLSPPSYHNIPLWDHSLEELMGRTTRAYDLVINYARDSSGGQRWSPQDSLHVQSVGKYLHNNVRILKYWQRADPEEIDWAQIKLDVENVRLLCEDVQWAICSSEKNMVGEWEMGRTREWAEGVNAEEQEGMDLDVAPEQAEVKCAEEMDADGEDGEIKE
jgi:hypothetical protein